MATDDRIDLDRIISDPDYRRATIRRLNAGETPAAQPVPANDSRAGAAKIPTPVSRD